MSDIPIREFASPASPVPNLPLPGAANPPWLTVHLEHRFPNDRAGFHLHLAFAVHAQRTVVFGPSGSGKSSLLRAIAGLLQPDAGRIELQGATVWQRAANGSHHSIPAEHRHVGLVMQNPAVFPHLTAAANVAFALRGMEKSARQTTVARLLAVVEAESLADRWPRQLSGGQLQRVAIARTLAADPAILLLDEPFAALDAESRQQLSLNLQQWANQRGVPLLTVTHNLEEAFSSGDEILAIKDGRIIAQGKPHEVLAPEREQLLRAIGTR